MLLNVFYVSIDNEYDLKKPETRWVMDEAVLLSKVTDRMIDKAVAWVKRGPSQIQVRNAAREEYQETGDLAIVTGTRKL